VAWLRLLYWKVAIAPAMTEGPGSLDPKAGLSRRTRRSIIGMSWLLTRHISGIAFQLLSPHIAKGRLYRGRRTVSICRWKSVTSRTLLAKSLSGEYVAYGREIM